jgi:hypothetical protein
VLNRGSFDIHAIIINNCNKLSKRKNNILYGSDACNSKLPTIHLHEEGEK